VEIGEQIPSTSGGIRVSNASSYSYIENGEEVDSTRNATVTIPVGSATAVVIGEARLQLTDAETGAPLADRDFIVQEQDGDEWKDLSDTLRATDNDGRIQVLGLTPGRNYRWQQIDFADHYDTDSLVVQADQQSTRGADPDPQSFTMPTNSGINFTATNTRQTYTITYQLGAGSTDDDIVFTQSYGEPTQQPDMAAITILDGYTFEGWNREIDSTVMGDTAYVARWSSFIADTDATRGIDPSSNIEPPLTYDSLTHYYAILASSLVLSLYFAPSALRAYRVQKYRK